MAYRWDYPVGPTDVALLGMIYGLAFLVQKVVALVKAKPADTVTPSTV
jgi:hypothetical protein